jgi:hypothetical protein
VDKDPVEFWYDNDEPAAAPTPADETSHDPDAIERIRPIARRRGVGTRLGVSVPGAIGGAFLVCAIAFGASLTGSVASHEGDGDDAPVALVEPDTGDDAVYEEPGTGDVDVPPPADEHPDAVEPTPSPTEKPKAEPTPKPVDKPKAEPRQEPTPKPEPRREPTPKPEPKPTAKPKLRLALSIREGGVVVDWSSCEVAGADVYKVVRSTDSVVRWPMGDNDALVAAIEVGGPTKTWDGHARHGKRAWYRVFCLDRRDAGYRIVGLSDAESIMVPAEPKPPAPEPQSMWLEAGVDGGAVVLHWEKCTRDGFSHYRILRKAAGEATAIAEVENASTTTYVDHNVEAGVEYHYLVQCKGHVGDTWPLLGTTGWAGVVAP